MSRTRTAGDARDDRARVRASEEIAKISDRRAAGKCPQCGKKAMFPGAYYCGERCRAKFEAKEPLK